MLKKRNIINTQNEENIFWVTMTDLLLGLSVVFMTLFVLAIVGYSQNKVEQQKNTMIVSKELNQKLQKENINAVVDEATGKVKISDLELFEVGSWELSARGKAYLNKFIPVYVNTLFSNKDLSKNVLNVIVEGHTDSQTFAGNYSKDEQFVKNMDLSTKRANSVASYIFKTNYNKKYSDNLRKVLTVEGKSYTEPILTGGKEDYNKSRRVELKLVVKDTNVKDFLMGEK